MAVFSQVISKTHRLAPLLPPSPPNAASQFFHPRQQRPECLRVCVCVSECVFGNELRQVKSRVRGNYLPRKIAAPLLGVVPLSGVAFVIIKHVLAGAGKRRVAEEEGRNWCAARSDSLRALISHGVKWERKEITPCYHKRLSETREGGPFFKINDKKGFNQG